MKSSFQNVNPTNIGVCSLYNGKPHNQSGPLSQTVIEFIYLETKLLTLGFLFATADSIHSSVPRQDLFYCCFQQWLHRLPYGQRSAHASLSPALPSHCYSEFPLEALSANRHVYYLSHLIPEEMSHRLPNGAHYCQVLCPEGGAQGSPSRWSVSADSQKLARGHRHLE